MYANDIFKSYLAGRNGLTRESLVVASYLYRGPQCRYHHTCILQSAADPTIIRNGTGLTPQRSQLLVFLCDDLGEKECYTPQHHQILVNVMHGCGRGYTPCLARRSAPCCDRFTMEIAVLEPDVHCFRWLSRLLFDRLLQSCAPRAPRP